VSRQGALRRATERDANCPKRTRVSTQVVTAQETAAVLKAKICGGGRAGCICCHRLAARSASGYHAWFASDRAVRSGKSNLGRRFSVDVGGLFFYGPRKTQDRFKLVSGVTHAGSRELPNHNDSYGRLQPH
jgi:hypothetical protein